MEYYSCLVIQGPDAFDMARVPSAMCPDCPAYAGGEADPYFAVTFALRSDHTLTLNATTSETCDGAFPRPTVARARMLGPKNFVIAGPLISQERFTKRPCGVSARWFLGFLSEKASRPQIHNPITS